MSDHSRVFAKLAVCRVRRRGMTLIEIMIVVVIMALVATGVGMAVLPQLEKAKIRRTTSDVTAVRSAVELYRATSEESGCPTMRALIDGKLIDAHASTVDAWGHAFEISCESTDTRVRSAGPDGQLETADDIPPQTT
ncbi:MAG: prepilin-type N-terminal cleavage/methylation domain-containing protein [Polyangiales bacterium]